MSARFSLAIDLGTSNSAIAIADLESGETRIIEIAQILGPNQIGELPTLPSASYIPHSAEFPESSFPLPWNDVGERAIIGQFARERGALVPDRLATSAKSWLSNPHIDPKQRILPWRSDIAEEKLSPFECSRLYLQHLRDAFLHTERAHGRDWDLSEAEIVVTVPASFDEVARSLTAEAAKTAGLGDVTLLEEPQAAFYAWMAQMRREWRNLIADGDIVLVCDIGGGTADFSLIAVTDVEGRLELERVSVGEHILLGGDNMDLALAYALNAKLEATGKPLDSWQFLALVHAASRAKILLFDDVGLAQAPIAVPSRGSSLLAKTVSTTLDRETLEQVVLDGFFPGVLEDPRHREHLRDRLNRNFGGRVAGREHPAVRRDQRDAEELRVDLCQRRDVIRILAFLQVFKLCECRVDDLLNCRGGLGVGRRRRQHRHRERGGGRRLEDPAVRDRDGHGHCPPKCCEKLYLNENWSR